MDASPPPEMVAYLFEQVKKLRLEVEALRKENEAMHAWARGQREYYEDSANEAGLFFEAFGME